MNFILKYKVHYRLVTSIDKLEFLESSALLLYSGFLLPDPDLLPVAPFRTSGRLLKHFIHCSAHVTKGSTSCSLDFHILLHQRN